MTRTSTFPNCLWLSLLLVASFNLQAQTNLSAFKRVYLQLGLGPATQNGAMGQLTLQSVLKSNWTASLSYYNTDLNAKGVPSDYKPGYTTLLFLPLPDTYPSTNLIAYSIAAGKQFTLGRNTWATTEAGLSLVKGEKFTFQRQSITTDGWLYVSSNYATTRTSKTTLGGLLKADVNWAFASFAGLSIGGFANLNAIQSPVGGEVKLLLGWMNRQRKIKS